MRRAFEAGACRDAVIGGCEFEFGGESSDGTRDPTYGANGLRSPSTRSPDVAVAVAAGMVEVVPPLR